MRKLSIIFIRTMNTIFVLLLSAGLTACSGSFTEQATGFQGAMNNMAGSFSAYQKLHADVRFGFQIHQSLAEGGSYGVSEKCDAISKTLRKFLKRTHDSSQSIEQKIAAARKELKPLKKLRCTVTYDQTVGAGTQVVPFERREFGTKGAKLTGILRSYASQLAALAKADDIETVTASGAKLQAQLNSLAKTVISPSTNAGPINALLSPVSSAVLWVGTKRLERQRYLFLRETVAVANPLIIEASHILAYEAILFHESTAYNEIKIRSAEALAATNAGKESREQIQLVQTILARHEKLKLLLKKDPTKPFFAMATAHAALLKALEDNNPSDKKAFQEITEFAQLAQSLISALSNLK